MCREAQWKWLAPDSPWSRNPAVTVSCNPSPLLLQHCCEHHMVLVWRAAMLFRAVARCRQQQWHSKYWWVAVFLLRPAAPSSAPQGSYQLPCSKFPCAPWLLFPPWPALSNPVSKYNTYKALKLLLRSFMVPLSISQHFGGSFLASGSLTQTRICLFFPHPSQWWVRVVPLEGNVSGSFWGRQDLRGAWWSSDCTSGACWSQSASTPIRHGCHSHGWCIISGKGVWISILFCWI